MAAAGARLPETILASHDRLNREDVVPGMIYRRNHTAYPLICYINNLAGCLTSENYQTAVLFLGRAAETLPQLRGQQPPLRPEVLTYLDFVEGYLKAVTEFLDRLGVPPDPYDRIPPDWRRSDGGN